MKKYLIYIFASLLTMSPKMSAAPTTDPSALQVEILIFSGRPNPVFTITDPAEIKEITALVNSLPKNSAAGAKALTDQPPALGYRGIAVGNLSKASPDLESFVVNRSNVQLNRKVIPSAKISPSQTASAAPAETGELRVDGASILENRLLASARSRGVIDDALVSHIKNTK